MKERALTEAQRTLLREVPSRIEVRRIERVWIFAAREVAGRESGLLVLSLLPDGDAAEGRRQVVTWRYEAERARGAWRRTDQVAEEGWAPAERMERLIGGVLARLGDAREDPRLEEVGGQETRWTALLEALGAGPVDSPAGE